MIAICLIPLSGGVSVIWPSKRPFMNYFNSRLLPDVWATILSDNVSPSATLEITPVPDHILPIPPAPHSNRMSRVCNSRRRRK